MSDTVQTVKFGQYRFYPVCVDVWQQVNVYRVVSTLHLVRSIYNLLLYAPGRNPGGYIDRQSCFLTAVVGSRLVSLSVFRQTIVFYFNIINTLCGFIC